MPLVPALRPLFTFLLTVGVLAGCAGSSSPQSVPPSSSSNDYLDRFVPRP